MLYMIGRDPNAGEEDRGQDLERSYRVLLLNFSDSFAIRLRLIPETLEDG